MLSCIVVAIELVLLSAAIWIVFFKPIKPYKINGDPWGHYNGVKISEAPRTKILH